jgi:dolichol-phosphate mannosyltransferase
VGKPLISLILSVYNEEDNLPVLYQALGRLADSEPDVAWEFVFVNDGSTDRSVPLLRELNASDARVKVVSFSRNFGAHETSTAGLRVCSGDGAVLMGSDMQDPPELIREFLRQWRLGYDLVLAVRASREDAGWRSWGALVFNWLVRRVALPDFPKNGTGGFCFLSRKVIDAFNALPERNRLNTGLLLWLGFRRVEVGYHRAKRHAGQSRFSVKRLFKTATDMILAFSVAPLRLITLLGTLTVLLGLIVAGGLVVTGVVNGGWAAFIAALILGGAQLVAVGVLGEYQWRIFDEVRGRPSYVIEEQIGEFRNGKRDEQGLGRAA